MHISVFGATGRTGRLVAAGALNAGHTVAALVRDPARLGIQDAALTAIPGSLQEAEQVEQAVSGAAAVISVLGPVHNRPLYEVSAATASILWAMQRCGVRRLVMTTGAGVRDPNDGPGAFDRFVGALVRLMAGNIYEDMRRSVDLVRRSDRDWTIVRVPVLTGGPSTGRVRVGYVGRGTGNRLSRADLADFLLQQVIHKTYLHQAPVISN